MRVDHKSPPTGTEIRRLRVARNISWQARTLLAVTLATSVLGSMTGAAPRILAQPDDAVPWLSLDALSPRERVGQLVVVAYYARPDDPEGDVFALVGDDAVGGVVLQKGNGIFRNERGRDLPNEIAGLSARLQQQALENGSGVPLFIAMDHEGDGNPFTHLREGFSALPSPMAIGATWDPTAAEAIGTIVGRELSAVGVNLLLGPGLDVLADPRVDSGGDIGIRSFGGSPYWVARLGAAYVRGVHAGGQRNVLTVAKHFPGHGGSDRDPDSGVSTVIAPANAIQSVDLVPFAAVSADAPGDPDRASVTDALMTSHIRYFGLQGNTQAGTPPISFDREGLTLLLEGGPFGFAAWREAGGLIVSDSLGVPAVREWFAPREQRFPNRQIARSALMAGNDVLLLAQFDARGAWDPQLRNIRDTLDYFEAEYRSDRAFRERVDEAAGRILRAKARLYPRREDVPVKPASGLSDLVGGEEARRTVQSVADAAVTVWKAADSPPNRGDRIVVITPRSIDVRTGLVDIDDGPLSCPDESCGLDDATWQRLQGLGPTLVEALMLDEFGPGGLGIVQPEMLRSLAFCQLHQALSPVVNATRPSQDTQPQEEPGQGEPERSVGCDPAQDDAAVVDALLQANWIVFAFADLDPDESLRLRGQLLPQVQSLARVGNGSVAVLSFGPPYYIDTTNLAQLGAHYSAYSKIPASIRAAIAAWFGMGDAPGASPVTVKNADYVLAQVLEPMPGTHLQILRNGVDETSPNDPHRIAIEVDGVRDHNGRTVPDGTLVRIQTEPAASLAAGTVSWETASGVARGEIELQGSGRVLVQASTASGATAGEPLVIELPPPTPDLRPTDELTSDHFGGSPDKRSGDPPGIPPDQSSDRAGRTRPAPWELAVALLVTVVTGGAVATPPWRKRGLKAQWEAGLLAAAGALCGYIGYSVVVLMAAPGAVPILPAGWDVAGATLLGGIAGLVFAEVVAVLRAGRSRPGRRGAGS